MDWRKYGPSPPPLSFAYRQIEISRWVQGLNCLSLSLDIFLHRVILYFTYLAPLLSILLHSVITVESLSRSVSLVWEGRGWPAWHAIGRTWPRWWGSETGRREGLDGGKSDSSPPPVPEIIHPVFVKTAQNAHFQWMNTSVLALFSRKRGSVEAWPEPSTSFPLSIWECCISAGNQTRDLLHWRQSCESRRQTVSSISRPRFREIWKVSALSKSLMLLGKKVSPGSRPLFGFSRPNPAENESPIANR